MVRRSAGQVLQLAVPGYFAHIAMRVPDQTGKVLHYSLFGQKISLIGRLGNSPLSVRTVCCIYEQSTSFRAECLLTSVLIGNWQRDGFAADCVHHHALCPQRVSCTVCQTARRFKGLAGRFLRSCVSGCALVRDFLVSAPPVSASWKPFPGAESRDRFASVGDPVRKHSARVRADRMPSPD